MKLHGSIDWVIDPQRERGKLPVTRIRKLDAEADENREMRNPAIVFGEAGKLRAEGPYLELLIAWSAQLREADVLLVVGYSFRDQHVNEIIARWFNEREDRRVVLLDPWPEEPFGDESAFLQSLGSLRPADEEKGRAASFRHVRASAAEGLETAIAEAKQAPA